jgi:hypothetical protein
MAVMFLLINIIQKKKRKKIMSAFKVKDTFEIIVGGQKVKVEYDGISYGIVLHFGFHGATISSTGYKSYFLFIEDYVSMKYTDYKICAQDIAETLYKEVKAEMSDKGVIIEQLTLF